MAENLPMHQYPLTTDQVQQVGAKPTHRWLRTRLMVALLLPIFFETFDYTVTATAQTHIASAFNRLDLQSWVGTSYTLTSTAFLPLAANCADIFGRHKTMQISLVLFLIGGIVSTAAQNMSMVLAGRGISGVGGAGMLAITRIIFSDLTDTASGNDWQSSILSILFAIGYVIGPIIGGAFANVSFRWIFAINIPAAIVSSALVFFLLRNILLGPQPISTDGVSSIQPTPSFPASLFAIDWAGATIFVGSIILILLGLTWGSNDSWSETRVIVCLAAGGALVLLFLLWEWFLGKYTVYYTKDESVVGQSGWTPVYPSRSSLGSPLARIRRMIPLFMFSIYDVAATSYAAFATGMVMFGCLYFLSIFFIIVQGLTGSRSGAELLYIAPGLGAGVQISKMIGGRTKQPRFSIIPGQFIQLIGVALIAWAVSIQNQKYINGFLVIAGTGIGLSFNGLILQARFALPTELSAVSVTLSIFFRTLGGTISLAQLSAVLQSKLRTYLTSYLTKNASSLPPNAAETIFRALSSIDSSSSSHSSAGGGGGINTLPPELLSIVRNAYTQGVELAFWSLVPWLGISCLLVLFLHNVHDPAPPASAEPGESMEALRGEEQRQEGGGGGGSFLSNLKVFGGEGIRKGRRGGNGALPRVNEIVTSSPVERGPRWHGPSGYFVYGVERLIGTRR